MSALEIAAVKLSDDVMGAIKEACETIAPTWPLDRMIAVNPYWERIHQSFETVGNELAKLAGSSVIMPLSYYRAKWQQGEITEQHLEKARLERQSTWLVNDLVNALRKNDSKPLPAPLLCDILDRQRDLLHEPAWCDAITHQIGQFCAAYFDDEQSEWRPNQEHGLYASWRQSLTRDHSISLLMKAPVIPKKAKTLAENPLLQIANALAQLEIPEDMWSPYLQAVMMRISGWASWCAYRRWQARLSGGEDQTLYDLLAIRLSWEALIDDGKRQQGAVWSYWYEAWRNHLQEADARSLEMAFLWQRAHEISYQEKLFTKLTYKAECSTLSATPDVQAVFCIDVRSEVFRRHFEAQSDGIQTLGFAGFFGLPISYTPLGTEASRPQLPGLLAPVLDIHEQSQDAKTDENARRHRQAALKHCANAKPFKLVPTSAFTLVETLGLSYATKLIKRSLPRAEKVSSLYGFGLKKEHLDTLRPTLRSALADQPEEQARIAAQVLNGMGLVEGLAPLVLLVGHGSQNQNNPQKAGLDCGACCGQTGEINARALADLLNDQTVRERLAKEGKNIPENTWFLAALHNTTTDEVQLFDTDLLPASHQTSLTKVEQQLAEAGQGARRERAPLLGLKDWQNAPEKLFKAVKQRANDWAQVRPEWGLANCASFIVAPRSVTRGMDLSGRSFLHDYDYHKDPEGRLLEQIMTAPMLVTNWINMQYHASTVDNQRYGSGNKTLHNVVGGRIGVFEGNGGDLRIGLSWQSVHDGESWRHDPLRLTVIIDAPQAFIDSVIAKHEVVRHLVQNQWLYLARLEGDTIEYYHNTGWQTWSV